MKTLRIEDNTKREYGYFDPDHPMSYLLDPEYGLYIEGYFIERLCCERQRTARSKNPFLMMLVDITKLSGKEHNEAVRNITAVLFSSLRETDLKGWYKTKSVIGVLFTEISDIDKDSLRNKIYRNLSHGLKIDQINRIEVSVHAFPDDQPADSDSNDQKQDGQRQNGDKQNGHKQNGHKQTSVDNSVLYPDLTRPKLSKTLYFVMKRMMDIVGSLVCMIMFAPLFVLIAVVIRLSSSGPIIFRQKRIGLFGKRFIFIKFRTMYVNNDSTVHREYVRNLIDGQNRKGSRENLSGGNGVYKIVNDVRVTPIGRVLRKTSLDELPQFFNVLKGDMSLVGPRPPIPYELEKYEVWHRRRVLEIKPGISGLWQVRGRSRTTFDEMVRLDLRYKKEQSLWLDVKILLQTPWAVLTARGAY